MRSNRNNLLSNHDLTDLKFSGQYDLDGKKSIDFQFDREIKKEEFTIIGHRGGGRNSDRLPASEKQRFPLPPDYLFGPRFAESLRPLETISGPEKHASVGSSGAFCFLGLRVSDRFP